MKAHLLFRDHDFNWSAPLVWNEEALRQDLSVDTMLNAMANGDASILASATKILLAPDSGNVATIHYRQAVLHDCLKNPDLLRELYALATEAADKVKTWYLGTLTRYPHWVLSDAIEQMTMFVSVMRGLRGLAERACGRFESEAWSQLLRAVKTELDEDYLTRISETLETLKFRGAMSLSAQLGAGNKAEQYTLHKPPRFVWKPWLKLWHWLFPPKPPSNSFAIHPRDEAGHRALEHLRDEGIAFTARALAQSKDHVRSFFADLRAELAFYVGCLNLYERLTAKNDDVCFPEVYGAHDRRLTFERLFDVGLALSVKGRVIGNDADADGKGFVLITGANQGGKSTFLRSVGLAQMMMQAGMFVPARSFDASVCDGLFTHYKREEDATMTSGKFDEELSRMSQIVDRMPPYSMILFNESFAATNEREGSEVARQIVTALLERNIRIVYVTHLYDFARALHESRAHDGLFLRAERDASGVRSFKLREGVPLPTSFGEDLYRKIFYPVASSEPPADTAAPALDL